MLVLGRSSFYRTASLVRQRFTPTWAASIVGVIVASVWVGLLVNRHIEYSNDLWWTFAFDANAPRMLRASLLVCVLTAGILLVTLLRPATPVPELTRKPELDDIKRVLDRIALDAFKCRADRRQARAVQRQRPLLHHVPGAGTQLDRAGRSGRTACRGRRAGVALPRTLRRARRPRGVLPVQRRVPAAVRGSGSGRDEDRRGGAGAAGEFFAGGQHSRRAAHRAAPRRARPRHL